MLLTLDEASARLEAAIKAQNDAQTPADSALALLALESGILRALRAWLLTRASIDAALAEKLQTDDEISAHELLDATRSAGELLTSEIANTLQLLHQTCELVVSGDPSLTDDELYRKAYQAAATAAILWPNFTTRPAPPILWPVYREMPEPLPTEVWQLQSETQRLRQRSSELEQGAQRLSRALATSNAEADRLRALVAGAAQNDDENAEWAQAMRWLLTGIGLIFAGLGIYAIARAALSLTWPLYFIGFLVVLASPVTLFYGLRFTYRGVKQLAPDRRVSYAVVLLAIVFLMTALFEPVAGNLGERAGVVANHWVNGALRSPITLVERIFQAPAPFLVALSGRSPDASTPAASIAATPTAVATFTPTAEITVELTPTAVVTPAITSTVTAEATPVVVNGISVGGKVRVVKTALLNARRGAGLRFQPATRFPQDSVLTVLQGPVSADNYTWWEVKNEDGQQGWCVDQWLEAVP